MPNVTLLKCGPTWLSQDTTLTQKLSATPRLPLNTSQGDADPWTPAALVELPPMSYLLPTAGVTLLSSLKKLLPAGMVLHACNPSSSGG